MKIDIDHLGKHAFLMLTISCLFSAYFVFYSETKPLWLASLMISVWFTTLYPLQKWNDTFE